MTDGFASLTHAKHVPGSDGGSVIFSPGGSADAALAPVFDAFSLEGSGYDVQSMVHALVLTENEALLERFRFDSEAGMFCAYGDDEDALLAVGRAVDRLIADPELARAMLTVAEERDLLD